MKRRKIWLLVVLIIGGALLIVSIKKYNRKKNSEYLYEKFERTYKAEIKDIDDDEVFIYLNDCPIRTKTILFYNAIAELESEYYGDKALFEDSVANALEDSLYIQIAEKSYNKEIKSGDLEDNRSFLQIQYEKGSELVSTVSKIRLDNPDENDLWIKGKIASNYIGSEIMGYNETTKKENLASLINNNILDLSRGYRVRLTPIFYEYCDEKVFKSRLKDYNFDYIP